MANLGIQNNNPGNLRDPRTGEFQVFKTPEEGHTALLKDIEYKKSGQSTHIQPGASLEDFAQSGVVKASITLQGKFSGTREIFNNGLIHTSIIVSGAFIKSEEKKLKYLTSLLAKLESKNVVPAISNNENNYFYVF